MSERVGTHGDWRVALTDVHVSEDDVEAVLECLRSGWLTMGPRTVEFEGLFAQYVGTRHAVAVSSGTAALHVALLASGIGPGDEVIVPDLTFVASASTIRMTGAEPVLCDIVGPTDLNLDVADVERRIGPRTRAVMAVHFCGYAADLEALRELCRAHDLLLFEDCAQAVGALVTPDGPRVGTVGQAGCFSLFSKKQLSVGEGGVITTDDDLLADRARLLRSHGMTSVTWDRHRGHASSYDVVELGFNYRIDEPRASLARSRLPRLEDGIRERRQSVERYRKRLAGLPGLTIPWSDEQVARASHFAFPILLADRQARDGLRDSLRARGIQTTWYPAISTLTAYRNGLASPEPSRSREASARHCMLPLSASLSSSDAELVVLAIEESLAAGDRG